MKILLYSANFAPEETGIGKYSGEMAAWLVSRGHQVHAVVAPPYYPSWKIAPNYRWPPYQREKWQGVEVTRAPLWVPKSPSGFKRVLHLLSFAVSSFPEMLRQIFWGPDLVIVVAPALVCAPAALLTARICSAQSWLHIQDFEVDVAFEMGLLRGATLRRVILRMERALLHRFDVVSTISNRMIQRLLEKGVKEQRVCYFPNWVDISRFKPHGIPGGYRDRLGIPASSKIVMFSGSLGGKQGLMVIPATAKLLAGRSDIVFVICGDGVMKADIEKACVGCANVRLLPLQPFGRLGDLLCAADIHLLPQSLEAADLVLPSKLSGMLASGRPVIATCLPGTELNDVVTQCGTVVPPEDSVALAAAICRLVDDDATRTQLGDRARSYAELNYEMDTILQRVFSPYDGNEESVTDDVVA